MALLTRSEIESAFARMGELAASRGTTLELLVMGGAAMVLGYDARPSTHDVDSVSLPPNEASQTRKLAAEVANELGWPEDWLNDGAKGFLIGRHPSRLVFESPGIRVFQPPTEQLLAMKLCAWRDDVDINDARLLLSSIQVKQSREELWNRVQPFLVPGRELTAKLAFDDLWESEP